MNLKAWEDFCDELKNLGKVIADNSPDELSKNEGYRYLLRLTRLASEMHFEHSFPNHPSFYTLSNETAKIGGDNPDNVYLNANLNPSQQYRVHGNVGEVDYLSLGIKENKYHIDGTMISHAEIEITQQHTDQEGNFSILINQSSSADLKMMPSSNMLIVRQTYKNKMHDSKAVLKIEALDYPDDIPLLEERELEQKLKSTFGFVQGTTNTFIKWVKEFQANHLNSLPLGDQKFFQAAGGDPSITYLHGYYKINPDECLIIETEVPECDLWNFQLENFWMESLDYRFNRIHLNNSCAILEGSNLKIHITHKKEELINNLVTQNHTQGAMLLRWVNCNNPIIPKLRLVKLIELQ